MVLAAATFNILDAMLAVVPTATRPLNRRAAPIFATVMKPRSMQIRKSKGRETGLGKDRIDEMGRGSEHRQRRRDGALLARGGRAVGVIGHQPVTGILLHDAAVIFHDPDHLREEEGEDLHQDMLFVRGLGGTLGEFADVQKHDRGGDPPTGADRQIVGIGDDPARSRGDAVRDAVQGPPGSIRLGVQIGAAPQVEVGIGHQIIR